MIKKRNIYLLYLIVFLQGFVFYGPIATIFREARGISISEIFIIESISFILLILLEIPFGLFADKFGYKKTLILSNFIFFISKIVFFKATSFYLFLFERALLAIALAGLSGCDSALLYLSIDKKDNSEKIFGKYNFYMNGGFLISCLLSGFLINISMDLAAFCTIISYGLAFFFSLFLVDLKEEKTKNHKSKENLKLVFKNKKFILFLISIAMIEEIVQCVTVFLNQLQYIKSGIPLKYFGIILAFITTIKLISCKSYKVSNKFGQKNSLVIYSFIITISIGCLLFISSPYLSIIFIAIISGAISLAAPTINDIKNKSIIKGDRATILSIYSMITSLVSAILNPMIGFASNISLSIGLITCAFIGFISSLLMIKICINNKIS
ncbi:MFS transporter [Clostridium sp.]|uniref:MFS transporter n=1 Tax=Clostridium sp. TaxID=1506 RepID=UPI003F2C3C95